MLRNVAARTGTASTPRAVESVGGSCALTRRAVSLPPQGRAPQTMETSGAICGGLDRGQGTPKPGRFHIEVGITGSRVCEVLRVASPRQRHREKDGKCSHFLQSPPCRKRWTDVRRETVVRVCTSSPSPLTLLLFELHPPPRILYP